MSKIICWWSGGVTSAVACKLAIDLYGKDNCDVLFIDTKNEHEDTYRFKDECQLWYGVTIGTITGIGDKYEKIQDVWEKHKSLNVAHGAICSSELKRRVREKWEKEIDYKHQVFGFDIDEPKRAKSLKLNQILKFLIIIISRYRKLKAELANIFPALKMLKKLLITCLNIYRYLLRLQLC